MPIVLDSYVEMSLKEGERLRRSNGVTGIDIIDMNENTPIPEQIEKFWASERNKQNLQLLVREMVSKMTKQIPLIVVSSLVCEEEMLSAKSAGGEDIPELNNWIGEADERLVLHIKWAVEEQKRERIIVVSNDTDTFAILLRHIPRFVSHGLHELWQQFGTGENRRMLPLHQVEDIFGVAMAKTVIKLHILSGNDHQSKVGTKHAAFVSNPLHYLSNFGEDEIISNEAEALAEEFLVQLTVGVRSRTSAKTFDQLRMEYYKSGKAGIDALPATSSEIKGLIKRAWYFVRKACTLLEVGNKHQTPQEALDHGWDEHLGVLLPSKCMRPLPKRMLTTCKCVGECDTRRCGCCSANVKCVTFCHGKDVKICKNC